MKLRKQIVLDRYFSDDLAAWYINPLEAWPRQPVGILRHAAMHVDVINIGITMNHVIHIGCICIASAFLQHVNMFNKKNNKVLPIHRDFFKTFMNCTVVFCSCKVRAILPMFFQKTQGSCEPLLGVTVFHTVTKLWR